MKSKIKILLVDDHLVVRAGFKMLLAAGDAIEVIGEAERGEQAIQLYQELKPDILVMDLSMPGIGGLETIRRICQRDPAAKILVFSVHHEQVYVGRALNAGAQGYITKNSAPGILAEAIAAIMDGGSYVEQV
nr:response regulator transcription factor [Methylomonas koyamae]